MHGLYFIELEGLMPLKLVMAVKYILEYWGRGPGLSRVITRYLGSLIFRPFRRVSARRLFSG